MEVIHTILVIYPALWWGCTVTLAGAQNMTVNNYNNLILEGKDVTLTCYIPAKVQSWNCQWYFSQYKGEEIRLTNGTRYTYMVFGDAVWVTFQLSFKNATFTDTGKYICETTVSTRKVRGEQTLNVHAKPEITVPKTNYTAVSGTNVTLECMVNASSETNTSIRWEYKLNQQWYTVTKSNRYFWTMQMPSLVISEVTTTDSNFYRCLASTPLVSVKGSQLYLKVQDKPTVAVNEYNYSIGMGDNLTLHCSIDGHGSEVKQVEWLKQENSQYRNLQSSTRVFWDISSPSLKIVNVNLDDAGNYACKGMTEFGTTESQQIGVQVFYLPVINQQDRKYLNGSSSEKYVVPGVSVVACVAMIALIIVVILIRRKRLKERTDQPNSGIRSTNGQQETSPTGSTSSGPLESRQQSEEDTTGSSSSNQVVYVVSAVAAMVFIALIALIVVIIFTRRRAKPNPGMRSANGQQQPSPSKNIHSGNGNGNPEIYILQLENPNYVEVILKSNTHIDKSTSTEDIHGSQVVSRTEELNYVQLEFNSDTHDDDSRFLIRGSPSNTTYTEVVSHR